MAPVGRQLEDQFPLGGTGNFCQAVSGAERVVVFSCCFFFSFFYGASSSAVFWKTKREITVWGLEDVYPKDHDPPTRDVQLERHQDPKTIEIRPLGKRVRECVSVPAVVATCD